MVSRLYIWKWHRGEHDRTESRPEEPMGENIPLTPVGGGSTWEPECEQETSFEGLSGARARLNTGFVEDRLMDCMKYYLNISLKTRT